MSSLPPSRKSRQFWSRRFSRNTGRLQWQQSSQLCAPSFQSSLYVPLPLQVRVNIMTNKVARATVMYRFWAIEYCQISCSSIHCLAPIWAGPRKPFMFHRFIGLFWARRPVGLGSNKLVLWYGPMIWVALLPDGKIRALQSKASRLCGSLTRLFRHT